VADETRERILSAAGPIFAERGFAAATVRELCAAADVNQAAINYYFGGKEALYAQTVREAHEHLEREVPVARWAADATREEKLRQFVSTIIRRVLGAEKLSWQLRLLMREMLEPTPALTQVVEQFIRPQFNTLQGIVAEFLPAGTPLHVIQQAAFSIIGQCLHYRLSGECVSLLIPARKLKEHFDRESLIDHITQFSLAALKGYGEQGSSVMEEQPGGRQRAVAMDARER